MEDVGKGGDEELSDWWSQGSRPAQALLLSWSHPWLPLRDGYSSCALQMRAVKRVELRDLCRPMLSSLDKMARESRWTGEGRGGVGLGGDVNSSQAGPRTKRWMCSGVSPSVTCARCAFSVS